MKKINVDKKYLKTLYLCWRYSFDIIFYTFFWFKMYHLFLCENANLRFWYQVLTCVSDKERASATSLRSATLRYFWHRNFLSRYASCAWVNAVLLRRGLRPLDELLPDIVHDFPDVADPGDGVRFGRGLSSRVHGLQPGSIVSSESEWRARSSSESSKQFHVQIKVSFNWFISIFFVQLLSLDFACRFKIHLLPKLISKSIRETWQMKNMTFLYLKKI